MLETLKKHLLFIDDFFRNPIEGNFTVKLFAIKIVCTYRVSR